jgi:hypothetical protein
MTKHLAIGAGAIVWLAWMVGAGTPAEVQAQAARFCTMPMEGNYSPGARLEHGGQMYQCVPVFGDALTPRGVAWIKVRRPANPTDMFVPDAR